MKPATHMNRRVAAIVSTIVSTTIAIAVGAFAPTSWAANPYPIRPIKVLVGFPAGGTTDAAIRVIAKNAEPFLGQPVVIDNRAGAGGTISIMQTRNAPPDGYTLSIFTLAVFRAPITQEATYDPLTDLTYIVGLANIPFGIVVRADSRYKTWADLLVYGKEHPNEMNYGVAAGLGNSAHLIMEEMTGQDKVKWNPIPYRGSSDTSTALLSGDVQFTVDGAGGFKSMVEAGKLRLLAVAANERMSQWPKIPTTRELGYRVNVGSPWGLGGPKGMDPAVVHKIEEAFRKSLETAEVKDALVRYGQTPFFMTSEAFTNYAKHAVVEQRDLLVKYGFAHKP
jgi:tripartite-type tricarboxylate transporter receptor subunit TctC